MYKWKNALDELPPEYEDVLACDMEGCDSDEMGPFIAHCEDGMWFSVWGNDFEIYAKPNVTHWMELPDVPQDTELDGEPGDIHVELDSGRSLYLEYTEVLDLLGKLTRKLKDYLAKKEKEFS